MTRGGRTWSVRVTAAAQDDIEDILGWTLDQFGELQMRAYAQTISSAVQALGDGTNAIGAKSRSEIAIGLYSLHVARNHHKGRHLLLVRSGRDKDHEVIEVLRVLHDSMDLIRHLPPDEA